MPPDLDSVPSVRSSEPTAGNEINVFDGARAYLHRWDFFKSRPAPPATGRIKRWAQLSATGNINKAGTTGSSESAMFLPFQEGFREAVEPGILPVVEYFALELDYVTYTSCGGHFYPESASGDERRVGILPRDPAEYERALRLADRAVRLSNRALDGGSIAMEIVEGQVSDRGVLLQVFDIYFARRPGTGWGDYFEKVDSATATFLESLRAAAGRGERSDEESRSLVE